VFSLGLTGIETFEFDIIFALCNLRLIRLRSEQYAAPLNSCRHMEKTES
jgi:hypothetical protein